MNVPRNHTSGAVINGKFYVAGGRPGAEAASALEVYDPATNIWTVLPDMPTGCSGIGAAAVNGELYVIGGEIPQIFDSVEVFNPLNNSWTALPPMPVAKHGTSRLLSTTRYTFQAGQRFKVLAQLTSIRHTHQYSHHGFGSQLHWDDDRRTLDRLSFWHRTRHLNCKRSNSAVADRTRRDDSRDHRSTGYCAARLCFMSHPTRSTISTFANCSRPGDDPSAGIRWMHLDRRV